MNLTSTAIRQALNGLSLQGAVLCVHGSLRAFGSVEGGAEAVIEALLADGRTVMMPAFYYRSYQPVPAALQIPGNGMDPEEAPDPEYQPPIPYEPQNPSHIDKSMGILPATLLKRPETIRGDHPLNAFAAAGPLAQALMAPQTPMDPYAPYRLLDEMAQTWILLLGVGLDRTTPVHYGETLAGRHLFHRWGAYADGRVEETLVGSCSEGFPRLDPHVRDLETRTVVGASTWRLFPFHAFVHRIADVVKKNPDLTHCADPDCARCRDMVAGGPA